MADLIVSIVLSESSVQLRTVSAVDSKLTTATFTLFPAETLVSSSSSIAPAEERTSALVDLSRTKTTLEPVRSSISSLPALTSNVTVVWLFASRLVADLPTVTPFVSGPLSGGLVSAIAESGTINAAAASAVRPHRNRRSPCVFACVFTLHLSFSIKVRLQLTAARLVTPPGKTDRRLILSRNRAPKPSISRTIPEKQGCYP